MEDSEAYGLESRQDSDTKGKSGSGSVELPIPVKSAPVLTMQDMAAALEKAKAEAAAAKEQAAAAKAEVAATKEQAAAADERAAVAEGKVAAADERAAAAEGKVAATKEQAKAEVAVADERAAAAKAEVAAAKEQAKAEVAAADERAAVAEEEMRGVPTIEKTYPESTSEDGQQVTKRCYNQPKFRENDQVVPHNTKQVTKKIKTTHDTVKAMAEKRICEGAWEGVESVRIPTRFKDPSSGKPLRITSALGVKAIDYGGNMKQLIYINEASVQDYVKLQVEDALKCLGLGDLLDVHVEFSIFSDVPDIVVVSSNGRALIFGEVKSPERSNKPGEVFDAEDVVRQVWSYLMGLKKIGNFLPIAFISTYNNVVIVTADDLTHTGAHKTFLAKMGEDIAKDPITIKNRGCQKEKPEVSPTKPTTKLVYTSKSVANSIDTDEKPMVCMSKTFDSRHCLQALVVSLYAAYHYNGDCQDVTTLHTVDQGDDLGGLFVPKVSGSGMVWTTIREGVKANYSSFPMPNAGVFYILARIGEGSCGKVFLASTTCGTMCVLKLYIPKRSNNCLAKDREEEFQKNLKAKMDQRDEESTRWSRLYRNLQVRCGTINGLPMLMMKYGCQLDQSQRKEKLPKVKDELHRFAKEGFAYKSSDLRWRHVVLCNDQTVLVDLESLEDISNMEENSRKKLLQDQMDQLVARMGSDKRNNLSSSMY